MGIMQNWSRSQTFWSYLLFKSDLWQKPQGCLSSVSTSAVASWERSTCYVWQIRVHVSEIELYFVLAFLSRWICLLLSDIAEKPPHMHCHSWNRTPHWGQTVEVIKRLLCHPGTVEILVLYLFPFPLQMHWANLQAMPPLADHQCDNRLSQWSLEHAVENRIQRPPLLPCYSPQGDHPGGWREWGW